MKCIVVWHDNDFDSNLFDRESVKEDIPTSLF